MLARASFLDSEIAPYPQIEPVPVLLVEVLFIGITQHAGHPHTRAHLLRKLHTALKLSRKKTLSLRLKVAS